MKQLVGINRKFTIVIKQKTPPSTNLFEQKMRIGVWWGYPLGPNGKYSVRGERVYESERETGEGGTSAD